MEIKLNEEQIAQLRNGEDVVIKAPCKEEFVYPIFKRAISNGKIVKFTSLNYGEVVWKQNSIQTIKITSHYVKHTDNGAWQYVAYDKKRDLWDGQPVEVWYDETHTRTSRFYDAVNKCTFSIHGERNGANYTNIKAIPSDKIPDWMFEAYNTLEF